MFLCTEKDESFSLNKGHSVWMLCLCGCIRDQNEYVWKIIALIFYHQYTDLYIFFNIYQITVISIAIQNIWTNENSCQQTLKQLSQLFYCFGDGDWQWDFVKMYLQVQQVAWLRTKGSPVSLSVCAVHPRCADLQTWARWVLGAYP